MILRMWHTSIWPNDTQDSGSQVGLGRCCKTPVCGPRIYCVCTRVSICHGQHVYICCSTPVCGRKAPHQTPARQWLLHAVCFFVSLRSKNIHLGALRGNARFLFRGVKFARLSTKTDTNNGTRMMLHFADHQKTRELCFS